MQQVAAFPAPELIGAFKTFGPVGPAYRVVQPIRQLDNGDWLLKILVLESNEEAEYLYTHVLDDPKAS
jgi:Family of unknown function (DUF5397)